MRDVQAQHARQSLSQGVKDGSMCVLGLCSTGSQRGSIRFCRALTPVRLTWIPTTALLAGRQCLKPMQHQHSMYHVFWGSPAAIHLWDQHSAFPAPASSLVWHANMSAKILTPSAYKCLHKPSHCRIGNAQVNRGGGRLQCSEERHMLKAVPGGWAASGLPCTGSCPSPFTRLCTGARGVAGWCPCACQLWRGPVWAVWRIAGWQSP